MTVAIKTKDNVSHKLEDSKSELEITLDERKTDCRVESKV